MKKFIIKTFLFLMPLLILMVIEIVLPLNYFTYRPWEALLFNHNGMNFLPNESLEMLSEGDLCYYSKNAVQKKEKWITDKLGFRNDKFIKKADVFIVGDSFITGSGLTQDSTFTNMLNAKSNNREYYNISPASMSDLNSLIEHKIIEKPKVLIFSKVERALPESIVKTNETFDADIFSIWEHRATRFYSLKYLISRLKDKKGIGKQSPVNQNMFFLNGNDQPYFYDKITEVVQVLVEYNKYCDSMDIEFLFLPLPNKETVYFDEVVFEQQPDYIFKLCDTLDKLGIQNINSLELFNVHRNKNNNRIYQYDDTHWNSKGVEIIADTVFKRFD